MIKSFSQLVKEHHPEKGRVGKDIDPSESFENHTANLNS